MISFHGDNASVMLGKKNGFGPKYLSSNNPNIFLHPCINHSINLIIVHFVEEISNEIDLIKFLCTMSSFFN